MVRVRSARGTGAVVVLTARVPGHRVGIHVAGVGARGVAGAASRGHGAALLGGVWGCGVREAGGLVVWWGSIGVEGGVVVGEARGTFVAKGFFVAGQGYLL